MRIETAKLARLNQIGYLSLVLLMAGYFFGQSSEYSLVFRALLWLPLLFPLTGILQSNPYTFAWANFILCGYWCHAMTLWWVAPELRIFATIEFLLISALLLGCMYYAKWRGQELGLKLPKLKDENK
ncbi:DUF2069 domain-containing protein [Paraferrimonas sp. SM1919]|uniref:DUF2069 domain-containing protein n=1 Tax=Paraferrimonas sp. SM1919 TaxID=2662263 RepID=UPI0013D6A690|nr:DUF2069 domain-containing protein [Paraferrimonas sp. SM1919]